MSALDLNDGEVKLSAQDIVEYKKEMYNRKMGIPTVKHTPAKLKVKVNKSPKSKSKSKSPKK